MILDICYLFSKKDIFYIESNLNSKIKNVKMMIKFFKKLKNYSTSLFNQWNLFFNHKYNVNEHVLILSVETEEWVLLSKNKIKKNFCIKNILDFGIGSEAIAIELKNLSIFSSFC